MATSDISPRLDGKCDENVSIARPISKINDSALMSNGHNINKGNWDSNIRSTSVPNKDLTSKDEITGSTSKDDIEGLIFVSI